MKNKSELIRNIIIELLQDGNEYNIEQIRASILLKDETLLEVPNTLNSVLYYMTKSDKKIIRIGKGKYKCVNRSEKEDVEVLEEKEAVKSGSYQEFVNEIKSICEELDKSVKNISYELSEEEYRENKKKYDLKKALIKLLDREVAKYK